MIVELSITLTVTLVVYLYIKCKSTYSYFEERGVKNGPIVPIFGSIAEPFFRRKHLLYTFIDLYNAFPFERIIGIFEFFNPTYIIRDPDLIKQIAVKDFDHFVDHRPLFSEETDKIIGSSVFMLTGDKWRQMRSALSPAFTGSKMKNMCPFMVECAQQTVIYLNDACKKDKSSEGFDVELKDLYTRFATDIIASLAFGRRVNSLADRDNEFFKMGLKMTTLTSWQIIVSRIIMSLPKIAKFFKLSVFHPSITTFFQNIFNETVKYREENNIYRPDMISILTELNKGSLKHETDEAADDAGFATVQESEIGKQPSKRVWTNDELASQSTLFFLAGFDAISTALSFTTMELVLNPEVQDKLREEVDRKYPEDGNLSYDSLKELVYLDMVISEGLRCWAPMPFPDRLCVKTYQVPGKDGEKSTLTIEKGNAVLIPAFGLHRDPKYWEEPYKFNPERFSAENKHKIHPFAYLPFGTGPRNCIGSRFALMEMKVILFYLIKHFKLVPGPKTMNPMVLPSNTFTARLKDGFWLKIIPRNYI